MTSLQTQIGNTLKQQGELCAKIAKVLKRARYSRREVERLPVLPAANRALRDTWPRCRGGELALRSERP
jgi:hypothetical protein